MSDGYVLVLDAGTSCARCLLFDHGASVVASATSSWSCTRGQGDSSLAREFAPAAMWDTFCRLVADCLSRAGAGAKAVTAIAATSQRQGVVFLDQAGREIYAGPNTDLRAVFEGAAIDDEMRARVYQTTGHLPSFLFAPAKLRWFQLHRPGAYGRIASVLALADWLAWKLTGVIACELTLAGEAGLLDINLRDHCSAMLADLGLKCNDHVPLLESGTVAGNLSSVAARQTGLLKGTLVAVAGADTQCGLLGMGVTGGSQVGVVAGWSVPLQAVTDAPILSIEQKTWAGCYLTTDRWVAESTAGDAGHSHGWLAGVLGNGGPEGLTEMDTMAAGVPAGSGGVAGFLGQSRMDMSSIGLRTGGLVFPVPLTFDDIGPSHLARASLEATAYAVRSNLEQLEALTGFSRADVAVGGGMSRSKTLLSILTNVLDRELRVSEQPNVSALGACLCAMVARGDYGSLEEAGEEAAQRLRPIVPDPVESAQYQECYQRWWQMSDDLSELSL